MPQALRVASVTRRLTVAGDETRLLNTAMAYDADSVEHVVIVVSPTDEEQDRWVGSMRERYRANGIKVVELGLELGGWRGAVNTARAVTRLAEELRRHRIDVVDARLGTPTALGLMAARLAGAPVVVSTAYYASFWSSPAKYAVGQACMARVDALISDARATLDDFDRWRWSRRADLVLIQNGVPPATSELGREEARARLGLPSDPTIPVIGQISRIIPRKGYETLLDAARLVLDQRPDVAFVGVGFVAENREFLNQLNASAKLLGIADRVRLLSYPGPIGDVYAAIDIFAHLSTEDSSPTAIHENMSVGRPAVITSLPGNLEIAEDRVDALLVPPGDPERAAAAMLELLGDSALANRLGVAARQRYEERHRPEMMAAAHESLFRRLLNSKRARN